MPTDVGTPFRALDQFKDQAAEALSQINQREGFKIQAKKQAREDSLLSAVMGGVASGKSIYDPTIAPLAMALSQTSHASALPFLESREKQKVPVVLTAGSKGILVDKTTGETTGLGESPARKANETIDSYLLSGVPGDFEKGMKALRAKSDEEARRQLTVQAGKNDLKERTDVGFLHDEATGQVTGFKGNRLKAMQVLNSQKNSLIRQRDEAIRVGQAATNQMLMMGEDAAYITDENGNKVANPNYQLLQTSVRMGNEAEQNFTESMKELQTYYDALKKTGAPQTGGGAPQTGGGAGRTPTVALPTAEELQARQILRLHPKGSTLTAKDQAAVNWANGILAKRKQ